MYDLETKRVSDEIAKLRAKRVLIQLPDGLRPQAFDLVSDLRRRTGAEILLVGDSCYGACDIAIRQAEALGVDLLVHYGHSEMLPRTHIHIIYVEAKVNIEADPLVEKALPLMEGWQRVGLATTVQHVHKLDAVKDALDRRGIRAMIGSGKRKTRYDGQILGCDYSSAQAIRGEVDGFLFIGGGEFHPLGLALATGKPVVSTDPYLLTATAIGEVELRRMAMRRMAAITAAKNARRFGIIVSLKPGQFELLAAGYLRDGFEKRGKEAAIICLDEVRPEVLNNFSEAEAFIDTACPRIALDGIGDIHRPILTLQEASVLLGEKGWEEVWGASYLG